MSDKKDERKYIHNMENVTRKRKRNFKKERKRIVEAKKHSNENDDNKNGSNRIINNDRKHQ